MSTGLDRKRPPVVSDRLLRRRPRNFTRRYCPGDSGSGLPRVPKLPEVAIRLMVDGGAAVEPAADAGVAALTAKVLPAGAAGRTAMQMAEWLDHLGASIGSGVGHDSARFSLHTLSDTM